MKHSSLFVFMFAFLFANFVEAQEEKERICKDGKPAAQDGTCPEDYERVCEDGQPAFEDASCPEDAITTPIQKNYVNVPVDITANLDLAVVSMDDQEIGQTPVKAEARLAEGEQTFGIIFPGFEPVFEDITVDQNLAATGLSRRITLIPVNPNAKNLLSTPKDIERFLASGLTVDGFIDNNSGRNIRTTGAVLTIASGASFLGMTVALLASENNGNAAVTLPLTLGTISLLSGVPTYIFGRIKFKNSQKKKRPTAFQIKPPANPIPVSPPDTLPTEEPDTIPISAPDAEVIPPEVPK